AAERAGSTASNVPVRACDVRWSCRPDDRKVDVRGVQRTPVDLNGRRLAERHGKVAAVGTGDGDAEAIRAPSSPAGPTLTHYGAPSTGCRWARPTPRWDVPSRPVRTTDRRGRALRPRDQR